ncbi:MAG: 2-C-methyl-D-erythritol 4-phosphate cytidylyltransferase [Bacillota bacterium]|jgi:2-C-methyl-D-erythritol 4-phosphate cytidylyltransferase
MLTALIVAAGSSRRMGDLGDKIFLPILGRPLIVHTLAPFCRSSDVDEIVLVTAEESVTKLRQMVLTYRIEKVTAIVAGGSSRQESVARGLASLSPSCQMVAIHDGARPCLGDEQLQAVLQLARAKGAAILAVPVKDTIKRVRAGLAVETPERSELFLAQTPQAFRRQWIEDAHQQARALGLLATDDAALVTASGRAVAVAEGDYTNIKVTTPEDLLLAELFLSRR